MAAKHGLGRGLGALIKDGMPPEKPAPQGQGPQPTGALKIPIDKIHKNSLQPRHTFDEQALTELADSIKQRGVLQPLLVRATPHGYELIAGERRLRASITAGLSEVPAVVMNVPDGESLEMALIENLQRENLNAIEEAEGYQVLANRFNLTQEQISDRVGKARASVANSLRLLSLPPEVKQLVSNGDLSAGHAKALIGLEIPDEQLLYARRTVKESLSVRNLEKLVEKARRVPRKPRASRDDIPLSHLKALSDKLHHHFGTNIRIAPSRTYANGKKAKGSIEIDFYSNDDLDRILGILGISGE
jgi:ParB family transcriptional regulator, chromosome partitioning protein